MLTSTAIEDAPAAHDLRQERAIAHSALAVIAGVVLSGPLALLVVALSHPQPSWRDAATFAAAYHPIQLLPYLGGFVLVGGCVALIASLHTLAAPAQRARANLALAFAGAFAALILLNYILQTTFVPALAAHPGEQSILIEGLSMATPRSLAWAIEFWGYGVLGVATWLVACVFGATRIERWAAALLVANGAVSVAAAIATAVWPGWAMSLAGGIAYAAWNALVVAMAAVVIASRSTAPHRVTTRRARSRGNATRGR